jgi:hypothetical protein
MLKTATAGVIALFLAASPHAYAQNSSAGDRERLTAADLSALTDARINIVKATLQLTTDQEKYWPAIEGAIRDRAKDRLARLAGAEERVGERRETNRIEALRDRNPVEFMQRRADVLAQRAADLKKVAGAWQPLYQTLTPDQKRRMGFLAVMVLRDLRDGPEQRRLAAADAED